MPSSSLTLQTPVDPADLRSVAFELVVLAALLVLVGLATLLPGTDRAVPGTAVAIREVVVALGALAVVVLLAHAARSVAILVRSVLDGPTRLVDDAGRVAGALVVFAAVLLAYRGFAGLVVPRLAAGDAAWAYDGGFLGLALVPLGVIARRLRRNLDPLADQLATAMADRAESTSSQADA